MLYNQAVISVNLLLIMSQMEFRSVHNQKEIVCTIIYRLFLSVQTLKKMIQIIHWKKISNETGSQFVTLMQIRNNRNTREPIKYKLFRADILLLSIVKFNVKFEN